MAEILVQQLNQRGCHAAVYQELPENANVIISLLAWQQFSDQQSAIASNWQNFAIARKAAPRFQKQGGTLVMLQDTGGTFGLEGCNPVSAWAGGSSGLIKTAGHEWPEATVKVIDLARGLLTLEQLCSRLVTELFAGGTEIEIGLTADGRRVIVAVNEDKNAGEIRASISHESVFLVSGGARGVTAACLIELARQFQPRFALLGRTSLEVEPEECTSAQTEAELKSALVQLTKASGVKLDLLQIQRTARSIMACREVGNTLQALRAAGAMAEYFVCDVQDTRQIQTVIIQIHRQWGPVTGIVHGAGVLADKLIKDKTDEQFAAVFNTKVQGLQALLEATRTEPVNVIGLFSSVSGRFGNAGQSDYAMANEILNRVAQAEQQKRGDSCLVKSMSWGPWEGGMVSTALRERFRQMKINLLPINTGAQLFVQELTHFVPMQTEVELGSTFAPADPVQVTKSIARIGEFNINQVTHSYLLDHPIKDITVLPICVGLEWFMRTAKQLYPMHDICSCENLKVLKPIRLEHFSEGHTFYVSCEEQNSEHGVMLKLSLRSKEGILHYTAKIPLNAAPPTFIPMSLPKGHGWPWNPAQVYQWKIIFHGPAFQVLQSLYGLSPEGGSAILSGIQDRAVISPTWLNESWILDVPMLDGGLQICWLWSCLSIGPILPMEIKRFVLYQTGIITEPVHATVRMIAKNNMHCVFQVQYCLADGTPVAEIESVEGVIVPL